MDIRCRKTTCIYNDRQTCKAKGICITRGVKCSQFRPSGRQEVDTTKHLFERKPDYAPQRDSKTIEIVCRANCMFNRGGKCVSNGISLSVINEQPLCVSFLEKK